VQTLYLYVENGIWIDPDILLGLNKITEMLFVCTLDLHKALDYGRIVGKLLHCLDFLQQNGYAVVSELLAHKGEQLWIAERKPPALRYAVGLVLKALRIDEIPFFQRVVL